MAVDVGTAIAYLNLDATNFNTGLANAQSALSNLQNGKGGISQVVTAIGNTTANIGTAITRNVTVPIVGLGKSSVQAAIDFESAFAGVKKTIDETRFNEYNLTWDDLAQGIKDIAYETGMSTEEIAKIMEVAGQLGIELGDSGKSIIEFTRQMALMGVTTDLAADEAAMEIAKFMNITGTAESEVGGLTAAVVDLGNNFATQEADIVHMAMRLATAANAAGFTQQEILALSAAMSSAGIKAEAGGSSLSSVISQLYKRVSQFGAVVSGTFTGDESEAGKIVEAMNVIAKTANVSSEEFYKLWTTKPGEALKIFIQGMSTAEERGDNMILLLDELGFSQIRQSNTLRGLATSYENMSDAIDTANRAWAEGSAMEVEAAKRFETLEVRINSLKEKWKEIQRDIAEFIIPILEKVMNVATQLFEKWKAFNDEQKETIVKFGAIAAAIGPVLTIFGRLIATIGSIGGVITQVGSLFTKATTAIAGTAGAAEGVGNGFTSIIKAFTNLGTKANWIIAIIMLVITAIIDLWKNSEQFRNWIKDAFQSLIGIIKRVWGFLQRIFAVVNEVWMALADAIEPIIEALAAELSPALDAVCRVLGAIFDILAPIVELIGALLVLLSPIVKIIASIVAATIGIISEIVTWIVDKLGWLLEWIVKGVEWLKYVLIGDPIIIDLIEGIKAIVQLGLEFLQGIIQFFVDTVISLVTWLWEKGTELVNNLIEGVKTIWQEFVLWFEDMWNNFVSWLSNAWETLSTGIKNAWNTFVTWITEMWNKFADWIKQSLSAIGEHIRQSIDAFHRWLEQTITKIKQTAERILQAIFDTAQRVWNNIVSAFERAKEHIQEGIEILKRKFEELKEAIHQKFEEIKEKIQQKFEEIKEKLENLVQMIKEKFNDLLQAIKEHFQKVFEKIKEFGQNFVKAWKEAFQNVQKGIASVFNHIRNGFQQFGSSVITIAKNVGNAFIKGLLGAGRNIKEFFANFIKSAIEGLLSSLKAFKETGELIMKNLWEGIKSKWQDFVKLLKELWDKALSGDLFTSLWDKIKSSISTLTNASSSVKKKVNGSHAGGLAYVPFNGYIAELHQGERVLTAEENQRYSNGGDGTTINFYSNEKIDEYTAARELRRTMKDIQLGLV